MYVQISDKHFILTAIIREWQLLEGSAYFDMSVKRRSAYYRATLALGPMFIRADTVFVNY